MKQIFFLEDGVLIYLVFAATADGKKYMRLTLFKTFFQLYFHTNLEKYPS
jgi:hypothetical protein